VAITAQEITRAADADRFLLNRDCSHTFKKEWRTGVSALMERSEKFLAASSGSCAIPTEITLQV
jgi:hypothetical protein